MGRYGSSVRLTAIRAVCHHFVFALGAADAIIHDLGISKAVLELVRPPRYREAAAPPQAGGGWLAGRPVRQRRHDRKHSRERYPLCRAKYSASALSRRPRPLMPLTKSANEPGGRLASYVDRIVRGEKPTEFPAQAPTKYGLAINFKAAKPLGLGVPPTLFVRHRRAIR